MTHRPNETPEPLAQGQAGEMPPVAWRYHCGKVTHLTSSKLDHYFSLDEGETYVKGEALVRLSDATAALQAKDAEIAGLKADAGRYRWLRSYPNNLNAAVYVPTGASQNTGGLLRRDNYLDAAIAAAIRAQTGGEG